jgi:hypothetical protein
LGGRQPKRDAANQAGFLLVKAIEHEKLVVTAAHTPEIDDSIVGFHAQLAVIRLIEAVLHADAIDFLSSDLIGLIDMAEQSAIDAPSELAWTEALAPWTLTCLYEDIDAPAVDRKATVAVLATIRTWAEGRLESSTPVAGCSS